MKKYRSKQYFVNALRNNQHEPIYLGEDLLQTDPGNWMVSYNGLKYRIFNLPDERFRELFEEIVVVEAQDEPEIISPQPDVPTDLPYINRKTYKGKGKKKIQYPKTKNKNHSYRKWLPLLAKILEEHKRFVENGKPVYIPMTSKELLKRGSKRWGRKLYTRSFYLVHKIEKRIKKVGGRLWVYDPPENHQLVLAPKQEKDVGEGPFKEYFEKGVPSAGKTLITCPECGKKRWLNVTEGSRAYKSGIRHCLSCAMKISHKNRSNKGGGNATKNK